jgi:predicted Zn-dependent protease
MKLFTVCFLFATFLSQAQDFRTRANKLIKSETTDSASDLKAELDFGRGLAARILGLYPIVKNSELQSYINKLGSGVASMIGRPEIKFIFAVIETDDINAYACPGGYIFLTKGLIKMLQNEAQLVGVIAHEIAHVNERHVIKKLKIKGKDESVLSAMGAIVGGGTNSLRVTLQTLTSEGMKVLFEEGLSSNEEMASDHLALDSLEALGYDVLSYKAMLENLKASALKEKATVVSKTHPKVQDRIQQVLDFSTKINKENKTSTYTNTERFKLYVQL